MNKKNMYGQREMGRVPIVQTELDRRPERGGLQRRDVGARFVDGHEPSLAGFGKAMLP